MPEPAHGEPVASTIEATLSSAGYRAVLHTVHWATPDYVPMRQAECAISLTLQRKRAEEQGFWRIQGTREPVQLGQCAAIAANTTVDIRLPPGNKRAVACFFEPERFARNIGARAEWFDPPFLVRLSQRDAGPRRVLGAIAEELATPRFARDVAVEGYILILLTEIARLIQDRDGDERPCRLSSRELNTVRELVAAELHSSLSLAAVSSALGISRRHMSRSFKLTTGLTFREFVEAERLKRTCHLLETTELPLKVIAHHVGLGSSSYLASAFSRWTGVSPGAWRKARRVRGS